MNHSGNYQMEQGPLAEEVSTEGSLTNFTPTTRIKCSCGENILKKSVVRNKVLVLEEDGTASCICPRCRKHVPIFRHFTLV